MLLVSKGGEASPPHRYLGLQSGLNSEIVKIGALLFNVHPLKSLSFLISVGSIRPDASSIARFIFNTSELSAEYVGKCFVLPDNADTTAVLSLYSHMFNFKGKQILDSLREFLRSKESLP